MADSPEAIPKNDQYHNSTNAELRKLIEEKTDSLKCLNNECILIERYLSKTDPNLLIGVADELSKHQAVRTIKFASPKVTVVQIPDSLASPASIKSNRTSIRSSIEPQSSAATSCTSFASLQTSLRGQSEQCSRAVNYRTKIGMLERICGGMKDDMNQFINEHRPILNDLKAEICERKIQMADIQDANNKLKEMLELNIHSKRTNASHQEDLLKLLNHWLQQTNKSIDRTRLQNVCQRQRSAQIRQTLSAIAQLKATFLPIDYVQLDIDKGAKRQLWDERNNQFLALKNVTASDKSILARERKRMLSFSDHLSALKQAITEIEQIRRKITSEKSINLDEIRRNEDKLATLQNLMKTYVAPSIMDYIHMKKQLKIRQSQFQLLKRQNHSLLNKLKLLRRNGSMSPNMSETDETITSNVHREKKKPMC